MRVSRNHAGPMLHARIFHHPRQTARVLVMLGMPGILISAVKVYLYDEHGRADFSDINACLTQPCGANSICSDLPPPSTSRTCNCKQGFIGDAEIGCSGLSSCHARFSHRRLRCLLITALPPQCHVYGSSSSINIVHLFLQHGLRG